MAQRINHTFKSKWLAKIAAFFIFLLLPTASWSSEKPTINWIVLDWRPAWILDGPMKGMGYSDRTQALLIEHMPDYNHTEVLGNWARLEELNKRPRTCNAAAFYEWKDEAGKPRKDILWSAPSILFFYHGIVTRSSDTQLFRSHYGKNSISIAALLNNKQLRFGAQPNRPFSVWIDPILNAVEPAEHIVERRSASNLSEGMFDLLAANRIDYFVDYYAMVRYRELSRSQRNQFQFTPIAEHDGTYGLGAFGCSASEDGPEIIARINEVLAKIRHLPTFKEASSDWFMRPDNKEEFNRLWNEEFLTRAK